MDYGILQLFRKTLSFGFKLNEYGKVSLVPDRIKLLVYSATNIIAEQVKFNTKLQQIGLQSTDHEKGLADATVLGGEDDYDMLFDKLLLAYQLMQKPYISS